MHESDSSESAPLPRRLQIIVSRPEPDSVNYLTRTRILGLPRPDELRPQPGPHRLVGTSPAPSLSDTPQRSCCHPQSHPQPSPWCRSSRGSKSGSEAGGVQFWLRPDRDPPGRRPRWSIKQAAGELGQSYRHIWGRIKAAEQGLGPPARRNPGGRPRSEPERFDRVRPPADHRVPDDAQSDVPGHGTRIRLASAHNLAGWPGTNPRVSLVVGPRLIAPSSRFKTVPNFTQGAPDMKTHGSAVWQGGIKDGEARHLSPERALEGYPCGFSSRASKGSPAPIRGVDQARPTPVPASPWRCP